MIPISFPPPVTRPRPGACLGGSPSLQELVRLRHGGDKGIASVLVQVEEPVTFALVDTGFAKIALGLHGLFVALGRGHRQVLVAVAEEDDGGRLLAVEVVDRRKLFVLISQPIMTIPLGAVVEDRIEKNQGIGNGRNRQVVVRAIKGADGGGGGGQVPTRGSTSRGDPLRIQS